MLIKDVVAGIALRRSPSESRRSPGHVTAAANQQAVHRIGGGARMANQAGPRKEPTQHHLSPGTRVQVRSSFEGHWSRGFEIAEIVHDPDGTVSYCLRRSSDGQVLPVVFPLDDIIPDRH